MPVCAAAACPLTGVLCRPGQGLRPHVGRYITRVVFIGGWRRRRREYYWYDDGSGYRPTRWYGRRPRRGSSFLRDACLLESGCCLAEAVGCGPQLALLSPMLLRQSLRAIGPMPGPDGPGAQQGRLLRLALAAIELYQVHVSPARRPCCRFTPTCSHYAAAALRRHGLGRGLWLTTRRLLRCRPGTTGETTLYKALPAVRPGGAKKRAVAGWFVKLDGGSLLDAVRCTARLGAVALINNGQFNECVSLGEYESEVIHAVAGG